MSVSQSVSASGGGGSKLWTRLSYGVGASAFGIKNNGVSFFLLLYYNQVLGLPATWVGTAIACALVIDAFADPLVGYLSDNFRSKWGRRHPFMYGSVVPVALSYYLLWNPPALSQTGLFFYLVALAILVRTFITVYEIPSSALVAELTEDYDERTSMLSYRYFFGWWGGLTIAVLAYFVLLRPTPEFPNGQLNPHGWQTYGVVASIMMAVSVLVSCVGTQRYIPFLRQPPPRQQFSIRRTLRELWESLSNPSFATLFISAIFGAAVAGLGASLNIYFTTYFWELSTTQIGFITFAPFISSSVALAVTPRLSRRFGKKRGAMAITLASIALSPLPILGRLLGLMPDNGSPLLVPILFCHSVLEVTLIVCSSVLIASMVTDTVEDSELSTGRRSEGVFFAARAFLDKAVNGIGVLGATLLLGAIGFPNDARPGMVDPAVIRTLGWTYVPMLLCMNLIGLGFIASYRISRDVHADNLRQLAERAAAAGPAAAVPEPLAARSAAG